MNYTIKGLFDGSIAIKRPQETVLKLQQDSRFAVLTKKPEQQQRIAVYCQMCLAAQPKALFLQIRGDDVQQQPHTASSCV